MASWSSDNIPMEEDMEIELDLGTSIPDDLNVTTDKQDLTSNPLDMSFEGPNLNDSLEVHVDDDTDSELNERTTPVRDVYGFMGMPCGEGSETLHNEMFRHLSRQTENVQSQSDSNKHSSGSVSTFPKLKGKEMVLYVPRELDEAWVKVKAEGPLNIRTYYNAIYEKARLLTEKCQRSNRQKQYDDHEVECIRYTLPTAPEVVALYRSLNLYGDTLVIPEMNNIAPKYRPDCLLIRGVNEMSTGDIFRYLRAYEQMPIKMEWVNDAQCIVIFEDQYHAARCLLTMTKEIVFWPSPTPIPSREEFDEKFGSVRTVPRHWIEVPIPKSHAWRVHVSSSHDNKNKLGFLFSVAKRDDRKQEGAEAYSDYYRYHGNPNAKGEPGIWTKTGYDNKIQQKKKIFAKETSPLESSSMLTSKFVEERVPAKLRLGAPTNSKRRLDFDSVTENMIPLKKGRSVQERIPPSATVTSGSLRSVTLQRRTNSGGQYDSFHGMSGQRRQHEATVNSGVSRGGLKILPQLDSYCEDEDFVPFNEEDLFKPSRWGRQENRDRDLDSPQKKAGRRSVYDRLGW